MKKIVVIFSSLAILTAALPAGCASNGTPATQNTSGTIISINTPTQPGQDQIIVQTAKGQETFVITPDTDVSYQGTACPIEDVGKLITPGNNTTYTCTIQYDETYNAIAFGVWEQVN